MNARFAAAALAALSWLVISPPAAARDFRENLSTELQALRQVREGRNTFRYADSRPTARGSI